MTLASLIFVLVAIVVVLVIAYACKYIIETFFVEPIRMPVMLLVGVILLLVLLFAISSHFGVAWR